MLLPEIIETGTHWGRLYGASESLAVAELAASSDKLQVVVAANTAELLQLDAELRFFSNPDIPIHVLSDWETLTYDRVSPHQDIISQRIRTLYSVSGAANGILLLTAAALMQRLPPRSFLEQHALMIKQGETLALDDFRGRLVEAGYRLVSQVEEHGEFAVRGSILDLFPMSSVKPFRVEFFDDEIETIRTFDSETQRGLDKANHIELLPAHEFPLNEAGIALFRKQYRNTFAAESKNTPIYLEVSEGRAPAGIEYYMPLFFEETSHLFEYLPGSAEFVLVDGSAEAFKLFETNTADRFEQRRHDVERPILPPADIYLSINFVTEAPGLFPIEPRGERPMGAIQDFLGKFGGRVLFVAESTGRREALMDQLIGNRLNPAVVEKWTDFLESDRELCLTTAALDRGLQLPDARVAMVTESQLGSGRIKRRERRRPTRDSEAIISNLTDLSIGAPVVHIDHGVGRYQGLTSLDIGQAENEYLTIEYAGDDKRNCWKYMHDVPPERDSHFRLNPITTLCSAMPSSLKKPPISCPLLMPSLKTYDHRNPPIEWSVVT